MAQQCLGRRTNERLKFGDRLHFFYTETRCTKTTEGKLCKKCNASKNLKEHGIVSEQLPPGSHIYESTWYNLKRTVYGNPSSEDMAKAKKAQDEARAAVVAAITGLTVEKKRTFKVAAPVTAPVPVQVPAPATVQAPAPVPVPVPAPAPVPVPVPVQVQAPVKAKRQPKKVVSQPTVQPLATESVEPPLQGLNCITITVRKIEHNGRKYYLNSDKDKLYTVMPDGGVGKYCGRLDRENDRIAEFPDSDSER
jgi:hypothetical protein